MYTAPRTWIVGEIVTASQLNQHLRDNFNAVAAVGDYKLTATAPSAVENVIEGGWLECNGVAVSRSTYSALFTKIGTVFGSGDGSQTFNLPDCRGRVFVAAAGASGHVDVQSLGGTDGSALGDRRPKHKHTVNGDSSSLLKTGSSRQGDAGNPNAAVATTFTVGPQTNSPTDAPAYLVAGIWAIKF